jgi:hypothetical protein
VVDSTYEFQVDPAVPKLRKTKEFVQGGPASAEFGSKVTGSFEAPRGCLGR